MQLKYPQLACSIWAVQLQLIFFKICGIAPFSVRVEEMKKNKEVKSFTFRYSTSGVFYNLALICCLTYIFIISRSELKSALLNNDENTFSSSIDALSNMGCCFLASIVVLSFLCCQKSAVRIADKLSNVDSFFVKFENFVTKASPSFYVLYFLLHPAYWVCAFIFIQLEIESYFKTWIPFFLPPFIMYEVLVQYSMTVALVKRRFWTMNHILSGSSMIGTIQLPALELPYGCTSSPIVTQMKDLKYMHRSLCEICDEIQKFYSLPVLVSIGYIFIVLANIAYRIIISFTQFHDKNSIWPNSVLLIILWLLFISPVINLSFSISKLLEEVKRIGKLIHVLSNHPLHPEVATELREFSLQLLHHKVRFSCYNFFDLNLTLVHSILHTTATYLVILIQYSPKHNLMQNLGK